MACGNLILVAKMNNISLTVPDYLIGGVSK